MGRSTQMLAGTIATGVAILVTLTACAPQAVVPAPASTRQAVADTLRIPPLAIPYIPLPRTDAEPERGIQFRLEQGATPAATGAVAQEPPATPLSGEATAALLARLPALPDTAGKAFRFPPASPPPPRTGAIVTAGFPPDSVEGPAPPTAAPPGPLEVVRVVPTGDTELAAHLTITFNQPMVPLTTVAGTEAREPPVRLSPQPPGRWTWLDTRTLRFVPVGRFPMATEYTVEVAAGTRSATGQVLTAAVETGFATPAPRALGAFPALDPDTARQRFQGRVYERMSHLPPWATDLHPVVLIVFDQDVSPDRVLAATRLTASGALVPLRLATDSEVEADTVVAVLARNAQPGRWVALRPSAALPRNADIRVVVGAAALSTEGARVTEVAQELRFRTYGPLDVASHGCFERDVCRPGAPWMIRFTNPLDSAVSAQPRLRIEPTLPEMTLRVRRSELLISGQARANTRYQVTIEGGVVDRFGQTLAGPRTVTFSVGPAQPMLTLAGAPLIVLDPAGPARLRLHSQGHGEVNVRIYRVTPEQWPAYVTALRRWQETGTLQPPGQRVTEQLVSIDAPDGFTETLIDVGAAFRQGLGHAVVAIEPTRTAPGFEPGRRRDAAFAWVQATRIGVAAAVNGSELLGWATSLDTGQPLAGVELRLIPSGRRAVTDTNGMAVLELSTGADSALTASRGGDRALLPENEHGYGAGWRRRPDWAELRWLLFSDRGLYRPGETAHVKGWLRSTPGGGADLRLADIAALSYRLRGPRGEELATGELRTGPLGGFHTTLELPDALNLGYAQLEVEPRGAPADQRHPANLALRVQEFRRPDYEVTLEADPGPHLVRDVVDLELNAKYYGGGGLGGAQVQWRVTPEPATYSPPGWDRWRFGRAVTWWLSHPGSGRTQTLSGATDASGSHRVRVELLALDPPFATTLRGAAQVQDVTRQVGSATTTLLVHPAALNVGLRVERFWVARGEPVNVGIVVVDHDGRMASGRRVLLVSERLKWTWSPVRAPQTEVQDTAVVCDIVSASDPASCTATFREAGMHRLRAEVRDDAGRVTRTEVIVWVPGDSPPPRMDPARFEMTPDRKEYQPGDTARVMIDAPFFPAEGLLTVRGGGIIATDRFRLTGATHELRLPITEQHVSGVGLHVDLVDARRPVRAASGETLLSVPPRTRTLDVTIEPRDSVVAPGAQTLIDVHVKDANGRDAAGAEVALWMVDEAVLAIGGYTLPDPITAFYPPRAGAFVRDHTLRAWITPWPRSEGPGTVAGTVLGHVTGGVMPGVTVRLEGTGISAVTSFDGTFLLRDVAPGEYVLVIDTGDGAGRRVRITVPADGVHLGNVVLTAGGAAGEVGEGVQLNALVVTADKVAAMPPPPAPPPPAAQEVEVRADFAALAVFEPSLQTDAKGRVQVRVGLPASLTRYRVMAVAVAGARHFGTGEATVTARKPLMARITAPRFLNYGDQFELPVLVQNATGERLEVDVAARAAGLRFTDARARRVVLPPEGRAELRFAATALRPGTARVQVITAAGARTDAARVDIPVYTPATTEAFATYGVVDSNAPVILPVSRPRDVIPEFGGAEISITSTALQALTDAVLYLHRFPFLGSEQLSSRILAVAALRDVLSAFAAEQLPPREELIAATQRDIGLLVGLQNGDGGWGFWYAGETSHPFVSVYAAHALQRGRAEGYDVPPNALPRALEYLRTIEPNITSWPQPARQSLRAYALYVRDLLVDRAAAVEARTMAAAPPDRVGGELPVEAVAWLLHIIADDPSAAAQAAELRRSLINRVEQTAAGATFTERYEDAAYLLLHSRRRTDAVVLDALMVAEPGSDLIPKLANSLLAHRVRGHWAGTQENAWVLLALNRYFRTNEATTPNFQSRVWLGERFLGDHAFRGRTTERLQLSVPMQEVLRADTATLLIAREGEGRMYYRAGLRYAPTDLRPDAVERGFAVSRVYEAVDDSADVQLGADGTWRIRAGARVRVRVLMVAPSARTHVALVDPLPAGFEPLNPELRGTGFTDDRRPMPNARERRPPQQPARSWWFVHQNLRDDRAEAFATLLPAGVYEYTYLARATTPGTFVVPPPRAEMLYEPETFGRGSGAAVLIVPQS